MRLNKIFNAAAVAGAVISSQAQTARIDVDAAHPAHAIAPTLWGIFFEDINMSSDGGIYPELVRNRSFEDADTPQNWKFASVKGSCDATISTADVHAEPPPLNPFNRKSLRVKMDGAFTLRNEGYWGMNFVPGHAYHFKMAARGEHFDGKITVKLLTHDGKVLASGEISGVEGKWKYHALEMTPSSADPKGELEVSAEGNGVLFLDMVSLEPDQTWKGHGLRSDLAESLDGLHPKFMRFPGGCWVEGDDFAHMNHWKNTIGDDDVRASLWNIWGYNATQGLGYHEYLQLAQDLGASPLFCVNCGMSHKETVPMDALAQWAQDALDSIDYANGPIDSIWGAKRAAAGHPEPFNMRYMEIGNENGGFVGYVDHWKLFYNVIKAKYPYMKLIADGWDDFGDYQPDFVDDHYYDSPEWFMRNADIYDKKSRSGPKVFVGEYAVTRDCGLGNLRGAIGEAAFMTGMERNSDLVSMASYAPLFVNLNHRAWNPNLINFDSAAWYGLPSYYVQQMFSENRGDEYLPTKTESPAIAVPLEQGRIGVGTWDTVAEYKDIQVTAPDGSVLFKSDFSHGARDWKMLSGDWKAQNGVLRQNAEGENERAIVGDSSWKNYTLTLKARKISGREGFLVMFHINQDSDRNWWNIGGWGNKSDGIEMGSTLDPKPSEIETDRWYDLKLTVADNNVKCWIDGALIHDVDGSASGYKTIFATSATDSATGDIIVKVVNASENPLATELNLAGAHLTGKGAAKILTSAHGTDENSLAEPNKVSPKTEDIQIAGNSLTRSFPGNSLTVLRFETAK